MSLRLALMQGRLLPPLRHPIQEFPAARWQEEFPLAAQLGFDAIEFIFDGDDTSLPSHPLLEAGCPTIRAVVDETGVAVSSICADYFMAHPLHRESSADVRRSVDLVQQLIPQAATVGATHIVIPCVDAATLVSAGDQARLASTLSPLADVCDQHQVRLTLEVDLAPDAIPPLIEQCRSPWVGVNYDTGNSAALGFDPVEEWAVYGNLVHSVHIKDRMRGGPTVPLGTGATRFDTIASCASAAGYDGLVTIQGARGSDDIRTAGIYKQFVESLLARHFGAASTNDVDSRPARRG